MEMRCYHKILHISFKDHVTVEEVCAKIQQAIEPNEGMTIVQRYKLQWYGHVSCSLGLAKTFLQGTAKEEEDKDKEEEVGRPHQGMDRPGVRQVQRAVENREKWRKLAAKSSVMPQRPSRLRD